ncbi:MAG: cupin [Casimicrobium sp.]|jgi:quercetin dioxygenase-like cupin family protein
MAIHHAASGELINVRPLREELLTAQTKALYKSDQLEVFRMVLLAGVSVPEHQVVGEFTVQCLEGSVEFSIAGTSEILRQGDLMCLSGCVPYALQALEDSSILFTLLLQGASALDG